MSEDASRRPLLVDPLELNAQLEDPALRIFDASVVLHVPAGKSFGVASGYPGYEMGHVPGAAFADLRGSLSDPDSPHHITLPAAERFEHAAGQLGIGEGARVVVYAQDSPIWATRLWWLLRYFGFDAVSVLDGGLGAWRAAGLPVSTETILYAPSTFVARPRPELLATRADVEAIVAGKDDARLLNALSPEVFRGEGPSSYTRAGRIPGSVNVPWTELIDPRTGRFCERERLAEALGAVEALTETTVVAYCGAGVSATLDIFAMALCGRNDVRLYDGSLAEWTAAPDLPVETG